MPINTAISEYQSSKTRHALCYATQAGIETSVEDTPMFATAAEIAAFFELLTADRELEFEEVDVEDEPEVAEDPYSLGKLLVEERSV